MTLVRFLAEAEQDLLDEARYLEERATGLGIRLIDETEQMRDEIAEYPFSGAIVRTGIRRRVLQKFRYSLFYVVDPEEIVIIALAHHSRRPGYWLGRRFKVQPKRRGRPTRACSR